MEGIAAKALELARLAVNESSEERGHNHSLAMSPGSNCPREFSGIMKACSFRVSLFRSEALRMFHRQTDDLAKAQSAMEGARLEAEDARGNMQTRAGTFPSVSPTACFAQEALQLRWSRGPVDRYIGQEVMDRLQEALPCSIVMFAVRSWAVEPNLFCLYINLPISQQRSQRYFFFHILKHGRRYLHIFVLMQRFE